MTVRLNDYHDLPVIQALYEASGKEPYPLWNWSCNTHGWWLIAEDAAGRALGCVQLYLSQPQAFLDLLCVPVVFPKRLKAAVVKVLCFKALETLRSFGVRTVSFSASMADQDWTKVLVRHGARYIHHHPTYVLQVS